MAVACGELITVPGRGPRGRARRSGPAGGVAAAVVRGRLEGPRLYDWALFQAADADKPLLVRVSLHRNAKGELELAFYRCHVPGLWTDLRAAD